MNLVKEKFEAMRVAYNLAFRDTFDRSPTLYEKFSMIVGDQGHTTVGFPFLEQIGAMRKWVGAREVKNLSGRMLTLTEDAYEETIGINVRELESDNWGVYLPAIQQMAASGKALFDKLAVNALLDAGNWLDGAAFFGTTRKYGKSTISNKTTSALSAETFRTARQTMMAYCGHDGEPLAVVPDTLMVGPAQEFTARAILENVYEIDASGKVTVGNDCKGLATVLVNPRITDNKWFLMACGGPIKPVVVQKSKETGLVSKNRPEDDGVFLEGQALFGVAAYGSAAAAFPHLVYGGIVA